MSAVKGKKKKADSTEKRTARKAVYLVIIEIVVGINVLVYSPASQKKEFKWFLNI